MPAPDFDHTRIEKKLIRDFGGKPLEQYGPDGEIGGHPVEVRVAKKEDRFRLNKDTHRELMRDHGSYIFDDLDDGLPPKEVSADRVDDLLGSGDWFSDRGYRHKFIDVDDIF